ncbi:MAG: glycosyltransferase family 2 protein [Planctomycetes bacterium]|nr:glycosyltransferase family 2 protein [Planctomycetota bacterium]
MNDRHQDPLLTVIVVSFNTRDLLRECLATLLQRTADLDLETIVVDNASRDDSAAMLRDEFPEVRLLESPVNLGFAGANNLAFREARGRYVCLLNSDAFPEPGAIQRAVQYMQQDDTIGIGGARLIGEDGSWQPSARLYPSILNEWLSLSGLAARFPTSRFFGRFDRTWADHEQPADVDWVPGAFSIMRRSDLERLGGFDEDFFLYYEEVDLCRRFQRAGLRIRYWPDVVVVHRGGESSKTLDDHDFDTSGSQLSLWRMRSGMLFHRKHEGYLGAFLSMTLERTFHALRAIRNRFGGSRARLRKRLESLQRVALLRRAWRETRGGRISPPRPWGA